MKVNHNTAERILDIAQELIQRRGYNAISFTDIADGVGIKKPSIVHHYPSKAALGKAVVKRYRETFASALNSIANDPEKTAFEAFDFYCTPYLDYGKTRDMVCLCGALAGEFTALPKSVQKEVSQFFEAHISWLQMILERGKNSGEFRFSEASHAMAMHILDSLQGALIVKRATGNFEHLDKTIELLKEKLCVVG